MDNNFKQDLSAIAGGAAPVVAPDQAQAQPQAPMTHADVLQVIDMIVPHMIEDAITKLTQQDQAGDPQGQMQGGGM